MNPRNSINNGFIQVAKYAHESDYSGFSKFDCLNSTVIEKLFGFSGITRLLATQFVNRVPLPLRNWTGVRKTRNSKGIANFIRAYCQIYHLSDFKIHKEEFSSRINSLTHWLLENDSAKFGQYSGNSRAWGYPFPWQSPGFFAPRHSPNAIVTAFCGEALLDAYLILGAPEFLSAAKKAANFLTSELPTLESDKERLCLGYVSKGLSWKVININSVIAGFLARLFHVTQEESFRAFSSRLMKWVMDARDSGGNFWNYTLPKKQSGIGPDNYHTGGILDGIFDHMLYCKNETYKNIYLDCLKFYREQLFTSGGLPKWRVNRVYPADIHGFAQGILTFSKSTSLDSSSLEFALKIADITLNQMQNPETGAFYYRKYPFWCWKLDLMRWNQSWMMLALAKLSVSLR